MIFDDLYGDSLSSVSQAVQSENLQLLQELLQNGQSTNSRDNRGWTPLHVAASEGYVEGVRQLLTADDIEVESLSHCGVSPLFLACLGKTESHKKVVDMLLSAGADPNMTKGDSWNVPLHAATENNSVEIVRALLDGGADPNIIAYKNTTALHAAAEVGALEVAQLLLEKGGMLNTSRDTSELTALHCLCFNYSQNCEAVYNDMLDLFLSHDCDFDAQMNDGTTPLMLAVQMCWDWAVERLLDEGADVYVMKSNNILVLHFAIQYSGGPADERFPLSSFFTSENPWTCFEFRDEEEENTTVLEKILSLTYPSRIPRQGYSVFHLAIRWKRYKGLRILMDDDLNPDEFLQEMDSAIIDCDESCAVPLIVEINTSLDTPLGFLLFQSLSRGVVDAAKYMIDKGSCINALKPGVLPPLVAALKNRYPGAYEAGGLGQEILQYLLDRGVDIMYRTREKDLLPAALNVSSLFNVVGFFRLLQHGVPAHRIYTPGILYGLLHHYQDVPLYKAYKMFPWLVVSWIRTANLFIPQLSIGTIETFNTDWNVSDENLTQAWQELETLVATPKSLQHLCVLKVRCVLGEMRGWEKLQDSLKKLHAHTMMPDPILDLLHLRWVKTNTLQLTPPASSRHLYITTKSSQSSSDEEEL
ncbi:ankyrin repeat and SOCS box protein 14-like isoform X1 [Scylla paramamosain]|uniref:ankyrin repeat and SOCS box protein 14-like isoform X1 n=2 Tax=Scylla paramamosain TaxID=85552 RepID=UPI003082FCFF